MTSEVCLSLVRLIAVVALERPLGTVHRVDVLLQFVSVEETAVADATEVSPLTAVHHHVRRVLGLEAELLVTQCARVDDRLTVVDHMLA